MLDGKLAEIAPDECEGMEDAPKACVLSRTGLKLAALGAEDDIDCWGIKLADCARTLEALVVFSTGFVLRCWKASCCF